MIARRGSAAIQISPAVASTYQRAGWHLTAEPGDMEVDADEVTADDLMVRARELDVRGRSKMSKDELVVAVAEAEAQDG